MAPEWEMGMAVDLGMQMASMTEASFSAPSAVVAPLSDAGAAATAPPAYVNYAASLPPADDFLDFSSLDLFGNSAAADAHFYPAATTETPAIISAGDFQSQHNSFDLYIPQCEDAAELEWLSQFVDDSFSGAPPYESAASAIVPSSDGKLQVEQPANGRGARSKRTRVSTGTVPPAAWSSSLAAAQQPPALNSPSSSSSSSSSEFSSSKTKAAAGKGKKSGERGAGTEGGVRRCTHCASEKTPQWRTGPLGPKTLCNACGVRYKSGRLVPEYRPAASPTFVLTQHSNSHRKVMELRRQKEILVRRRQDPDSPVARPELLYNDYGVC